MVISLGEQVKVLQKGKITIPAGIRQKLDIKEGDRIELQIIDNKLVLFPPNIIPNPTETLTGLASEAQIVEPIKNELRKAAASRVKKKTQRSKQ